LSSFLPQIFFSFRNCLRKNVAKTPFLFVFYRGLRLWLTHCYKYLAPLGLVFVFNL
jgi:hypothetical protein